MSILPASIEAYLQEAGFSKTEITVLKKFLEEKALTLRQLAAKTGRSTGVLDQAVKKLLKKDILAKEMINSVYKYSLSSLEPIMDWMEKDLQVKQKMLIRRHESFRSFISSITIERSKPELEYFEGTAGMMQAYTILLDNCSEMLHYLPIYHKEEDDPLASFRSEYAKERKSKNIFSRVLAPNNALTRRFQSRDLFNFRQTLLVEENRYPFFIEQVLTADKIAYIDHEKQTACILHFSHLAYYDSLFFEADWLNALQEKNSHVLSVTLSQ